MKPGVGMAEIFGHLDDLALHDLVLSFIFKLLFSYSE